MTVDCFLESSTPCPRRNYTDFQPLNMLGRYVLSEPVSRNQLTRCARLSMGNVLFCALYLRFVWVLINVDFLLGEVFR